MLENMEQVREKTCRDGVICERPVFKPLHKSLAKVECPDSDRAYDHALSIPLYPSLSQEETDYLLGSLQDCLKATKTRE